MRDVAATIEWYKTHETEAQIGFNPDGMCLKICRTARDIPALFPTAVAAQEGTPAKYRVTDVADVRVGMVGYFDDPVDENPFGHIVTWVGRVKGEDRSSIRSLLGRTNSVKSGEVVVVRGDFFQREWGDEYQFSATWLNGQALTGFNNAPLKRPKSLEAAIASLQRARDRHKAKGHTRLVRALDRDIEQIRQTIRTFS